MNCISCGYEGRRVKAAKNRPACNACVARGALRGVGSHGLPWHVRVFGRAVIVASGCWEYSASRDKMGYGSQIMVDRRHVHPHRLALIGTQGPPPTGKETDHLCHNRACVNPNHLRWATHRENVRNRRIPCLTVEEKRTRYRVYQRAYWAKHRDYLNACQRRRRAKTTAVRQETWLSKVLADA